MDNRAFQIHGRVLREESGEPLSGLRVETWDLDEAFGPVAVGTTDQSGTFAVHVDERHRAMLRRWRPAAFVRVYESDVLICETGPILDDLARGATHLTIHASPSDTKASPYLVKGRVIGADDGPLAKAQVHAFDCRLRDEVELGHALTDKQGRYSIKYDAGMLAGRTNADLVVRVLDAMGNAIVESPVLFGAAPTQVVNLAVGASIYRGPSDFTRADRALAPVLAGAPAADLTPQEISFAASTTNLDERLVQAYAAAAAIADKTSLSAATAFALVQSGLPPQAEALVGQSPTAIRAALAAAASANAAPPTAVAEPDAVIARLRAYAIQAALKPGDPASLDALLSTVLNAAEDRQRFLELAATNDGDTGLWEAVAKDPRLGAQVDPLRFAVHAGVVTENNAPLVKRLQAMQKKGTISDAESLAGLTAQDWLGVIESPNGGELVEPPPGVPGADDATRRANYAHVLSRITEDMFPAAALRLRLASDMSLPGGAELATFFRANPSFAPGLGNVDVYLAENPRALDGATNPTATLESLKSLERMTKITQRSTEIVTFLKGGLSSAFQLASLGEMKFSEMYADSLGRTRAGQIYRAASHTSAAALNLLVDLAPPFNLSLNAVPYEVVRQTGVPDWEALFGSVSLCDCEDCRTVLSPAAYLTDILKFLHDRPAKNGKTPKDVLFERRPDIGEIELTCENTNTPLPYVDLLDEVLECAIAPTRFTVASANAADLDAGTLTASLRNDFQNHGFLLSPAAQVEVITGAHLWHVVDPGWRFPITAQAGSLGVSAMPQTSLEPDDLGANPEHENAAAYGVLRKAVYPISLPFHLWIEEARAYLTHLGVARDGLMRTFQTAVVPSPQDAAIAAEGLGLTPVARQIVNWTHPQAGGPYVFWGLPAGQWPRALQTVQTLLDRASLTYDELLELLKLVWLNGSGKLVIAPDIEWDPYTCDPKHLRIAALDADAANRLQRFVRLWRPLGWQARELDKAITALKPPTLNDDLLRMLNDIDALRTELQSPVTCVLGWFARLDARTYPDTESPKPRSLYAELFQNPSVIKLGPGETDPFALNATPDVATIVSLHVLDTDAKPVEEQKRRLRAAVGSALGLSRDDLTALLEGPNAITFGYDMNLENLSRLFRYASFAGALKLKIPELLALERLFGMSAFVNDGVAVTPAETMRAREFVESVQKLRASGFSIPLLLYLLRHETLPGNAIGPADDAVGTLLNGLRPALKKIVDATSVVADPLGQTVGQVLATLGWDTGRVRDAVDAVGGSTVVYSSHLDPLPGAITFPSTVPVAYDASTHALTYTGAMSDAYKATLLALSGDAAYQAAVLDLYGRPRAFVATALKTFVDPVYTAPLAALPASSVQFPAPTSARISYDSDAQMLSYTGTMSSADEAKLLALSADAAYQVAVTALQAQPSMYVAPPDNAFLTTADASKLFEEAQAPADRYRHVLIKLDAYLRTTESEALVKQTIAAALKLDVAVVDVLLTQWHDDSGAPAHRAMQEFVDPAFVTSTDKPTVARFPALFRTYARLWKVAQITSTLGLSVGDVEWLDDHAAAIGWLAFNGLPATPADPPAPYGPWQRLVDAMAFRVTFNDASETFLGLLGTALEFNPTSGKGAATKTELIDGWSAFGPWSEDDLQALLGQKAQTADRGLLGFRFPLAAGDPNDYADERTWYRIADAFSDLERLGASPAQAIAWSHPDLGADDARAIKQAARSKYDTAQWYLIAKPLRDAIRDRQRAALVAYLVAAHGRGGTDARGLTEYYLIDCEMGSCMLTSRIKQAISSVQMFAQRCLMNLEPEVEANVKIDKDWADWKWMKSYRVWEAARKVFLWPENFVEPELRDDKSPFFLDLENALGHKEMTAGSVEDAFLGYLESLDGVTQLTVAGIYHEVEHDSEGNVAVDVLHVLGRTASTPPRWFYRKADVGLGPDTSVASEWGWSWSPWEKVDAEIDAVAVLPVIWNRRLFLFWPDLTAMAKDETLTMPASGHPVSAPPRFWRTKLCWTERHQGKWSAKKTTPVSVDSNLQYDASTLMLKPSFHGANLVIDLVIPDLTLFWWHFSANEGTFTFVGTQPGVVEAVGPSGFFFLPGPGPYPQGTIAAEMTWQEPSLAGEPLDLLDFSAGPGSPLTNVEVLAQTPSSARFRVTVQNPIAIDPTEPLFFADGDHSYLVTSSEWGERGPPRAAHPSSIGKVPWQYYHELTPPPIPGPLGRVSNLDDPPSVGLSFPVLRAASGDRGHLATGPALVDGGGDGAAARAATTVPQRELTMVAARPPVGAAATSKTPIPSPSTRVWRFEPFYHPYIRELVGELQKDGIGGLLQRRLQLEPWLFSQPPGTKGLDFRAHYKPQLVDLPMPEEEIDFSATGSYALYNWELFFHAPLLIATRLSQNQQFEDAQKWFHYIFDPTDASALLPPQKYWQTRPFYETGAADYQQQRIDNLLLLLASGSADPELFAKEEAWRNDPFNPHLVARLRTTAYQKSVVMKYLDNLIAWGDQLFRGDTIELINEATQLYILAADILGRRPELIKSRAEGVIQTYNTIEPHLYGFSDALVAAESLVPAAPQGLGDGGAPQVTLPPLLYFAVPKNTKLFGYWTTVADRLYKIRNCMNIEGVVQQLPLFEPPIDPALLAQAAAAGVDLSSALNDISAPLPAYKFPSVAQKATELCVQTMTLGNLLLSTLEKRDAEDLAVLRATQEATLLAAVRDVRQKRIDEAKQAADALRAREAFAQDRSSYYTGLLTNLATPPYLAEGVNLLLLADSALAQVVSGELTQAAAVAHFIPDFKIGSPTTIGGTYGGSNVGPALGALAAAAGSAASVLSTGASASAIIASWLRRAEEWQHQKQQADLELKGIAKEIAAADIRTAIAEKELENHDLQTENANAVAEFLQSKFTNRDLYDWMVGQVSAVYFQSYQLSYDLAKRAERCYCHELGLQSSNFIRFGYWDSLKKGLLAADRLHHDLKRMEAARLDQDRREYELTKIVSLAQVDPAALVKLKQTGACFVTMPESIFDEDHPGHYMRRLKTVALTVPCVAGPYTGVHCTLSYLGGMMRIEPDTSTGYARTGADDTRFVDSVGPIQSISTSGGQSDSGLFELSFRDERYLPFEGEGAADSVWRLGLDPDANRFDLDTVTDVLVQVRYTAREGGQALSTAAKAALPKQRMQAFSARHDFADAWHRFLHPADDAALQLLELDLTKDRFPFQPGGADVKLSRIDVYLKVEGVPSPPPPPEIPLQLHASADGTGTDVLGTTPLTSVAALDKLFVGSADLSGSPGSLGASGVWSATIAGAQVPTFLVHSVTVGGVTYNHLDPASVDDLVIVCTYEPA